MTPKTLSIVGEALYGPRWQVRMSIALDVNDRTVRRWYAGELPIPDRLYDDLAALCLKRRSGLDEAVRLLRLESRQAS